MSRAGITFARAAIFVVVGLLLVAGSKRAFAQAEIIDAVGLVDFRGRPNFHVGSWAKYRTVGKSLLGRSDDYTTTLLIAGEEMAWGEPCVWVETWVERDGGLNVTASLVSYAAFGDTMTINHLGWFLRKAINGMTSSGLPEQTLAVREENELHLRKVNWDAEESQIHEEVLGSDSVTVPVGRFLATKILRTRGHGGTSDDADSTTYYEQRTSETHYRSRDVPITSLVKIDIDDVQRGKSWAIGHFNRDSLKILERAQGSTTLIGMGRGNLLPRLVPESVRHPIADRRLVDATVNQPMESSMRILKPGESIR